MDVRGTVTLGLRKDPTDHLNHRRVVIDYFGSGTCLALSCGFNRFKGHDQSVNTADGPIAAVDCPANVGSRGEHEIDRMLTGLRQQRAQLVSRSICDGNAQNSVFQMQGDSSETACDFFRHQRDRFGRRILASEVNHGKTEDLT